MTDLFVEEHPLLDVAVFLTRFPAPLGGLETPEPVRRLLSLEADAPLRSDDPVRTAVRDLLRQGGFKPTGRSKPASEYLVKAVQEGWISPQQGINPAVDVCNAVSLHSGLPISVLDLDLMAPPWRIALGPPGASYVFNPSGQAIDIGGLLSVWDAEGPCGGPVKDSQRTKTSDSTTSTLSVIWGTKALPGRTAKTVAWYRALLGDLGAGTELLAG